MKKNPIVLPWENDPRDELEKIEFIEAQNIFARELIKLVNSKTNPGKERNILSGKVHEHFFGESLYAEPRVIKMDQKLAIKFNGLIQDAISIAKTIF